MTTNAAKSNVLVTHKPTGPLGEVYLKSISPYMSPAHKLAYRYAHNISQAFTVDASPHILNILDAAHINGWASYSLYDSVLDSNETHHVPTATTALRISLDLFISAAIELGVPNCVIHKCFETMDQANHWEISHARSPPGVFHPSTLPQYGNLNQLAERSWGNSLVLQILLHDDARLGPALEFMHHYLIVRQLFDDIKDWQEDYANGHVSYVVTTILQLKGTNTNDMTNLQKVFLLKALPNVLKTSNYHLNKADLSLTKIGGHNTTLFRLWLRDASARLATVGQSLNDISNLT